MPTLLDFKRLRLLPLLNPNSLLTTTCPGWGPEYTYDVAPLWFSVLLELCPGLNAIFVLGFTYVIYSVVAGLIDILIYRLEVEASKTEKKSDDIKERVIGSL